MAISLGKKENQNKRRRLIGGFSFRWSELFGLFISSVVVLLGLWMVYQAKTSNPDKTSFVEIEEKIKNKQTVNVNKIAKAENLLPVLTVFENESDRKLAAAKIFAFVIQNKRAIEKTSRIADIRVERNEIDDMPELVDFKQRLNSIRQDESRQSADASSSPVSLFTAQQFNALKPVLIVRNPQDFQTTFWKWAVVMFLIFYVVHLGWTCFGFKGDQLLLPVIHLLSGLGIILMTTLRDPLHDSLDFYDFILGLLAGVALLFVCSLIDWQRRLSGYALIPLSLAVTLFAGLLFFGKSPGASGAVVNLFGFQPSEYIKILVVLFLAGYFANNWEFLRELKPRSNSLTEFLRINNLPRLRFYLPVLIAVGASLTLFSVVKDLGPALIVGCTFLALYAVARRRWGLVLFGGIFFAAGLWAVYQYTDVMPVVYHRINIWLDPFENGLRGGDQIAQGWWAMATGGLTGTGLGLGEPALIPAGHTDLVLASLGEELGFVGVTIILVLYSILLLRAIQIALKAKGDYSFFLALGLTLITGVQIALITGGVFGLVPLTGVVSPFLSWGKSSMIASCIVFGILLAISAKRETITDVNEAFKLPVLNLTGLLVIVVITLLGRAAYLQVWKADENIIAPVLTKQRDGEYRYIYNRRVLEAERLLPLGSIYDRNGIPLASSDWYELEKHRQVYENLGVNIDAVCSKDDHRCYPFGAKLFHLLGNRMTRENWGASNSSYIERDYNGRLRGYNDHSELIPRTVTEIEPQTKNIISKEITVLRRDLSELLPLVHYRHRPEQADAKALLERERNVRASIDIGLQLKVGELLKQQISQAGKERGAAVVLDAETGDLLAAASYPIPSETPRSVNLLPAFDESADDGQRQKIDEQLNRTMFAVYPPGSTFKIVTATAALRKDPALAEKTFECKSLSGGRVGNIINGRVIRDDVGDRAAHGHVTLENGIIHSCNAYFAQLGVYEVEGRGLLETSNLFELSFTTESSLKVSAFKSLNALLPQASYGQSPILVTPFQMARVAATIANDGKMSYGRWVIDDSNQRKKPPVSVLNTASARNIADAMRGVVTHGTAKRVNNRVLPIAGKTGTAEVENAPSHSWFIGFAPYGHADKIAFSVIIENGGYGGRSAAPLAGEIVKAAGERGLIR